MELSPDQAGMARPFGWGIAGTGEIARRFAEDLRHAPGARLAAVQSRSQGKAETFAADWPGCVAHEALERLLAEEQVDAIYIATPNATHAEQALKAIAAGKPVLVEKPLACHAVDARRIRDAAEAAGVFVMEAMWSRFLPAVQAVRAMIAEGAIGEIRQIRADLSYFRPESAATRFFDPAQGGGAALDLGVYPLSLALLLMGRPSQATGEWQAASTGVDMRMSFALAYPGATARLSCSFDRDGANCFVIEGSKGFLRLDAPFLKAQRLTRFSPFAARLPLIGPAAVRQTVLHKALRRLPLPGRAISPFPFPGSGLQFEAAAVMEAVRSGKVFSPVSPLADSIAVLDIIDAVRKRPASSGPLEPAV